MSSQSLPKTVSGQEEGAGSSSNFFEPSVLSYLRDKWAAVSDDDEEQDGPISVTQV